MNTYYSFKPKTNSTLIPGQFWSIPLSNGKFTCGRVIQVTRNYQASPTKTFLAGLMNWVGDNIPKEEDLKDSQTLDQGVAHINSIYETAHNGMILGMRNLELDNIEPYMFRSQIGYQKGICKLMKGLIELRAITKKEWAQFNTLGIWGTDFIKQIAEYNFVN